MKKYLVGFVLAVGIFAGFSPVVWAEEEEIAKEPSCFWLGVNDSLQNACKDVKRVKKDAELWIAPLEEKAKKLNGSKEVISEKIFNYYKNGDEIYKILDDNDDFISNDKCPVANICTSDIDNMSLINKTLNLYTKGLIKYYEGMKSDSEIAKEKYFREAIDYFQKAEKFARKPVIHSGGILPGPKAESSGEDYLLNKFLVKTINGALVMLFSVGTLMLIIGGLMFIFASEEEEMKTKAKSTIFWGIAGIVIAIMAYTIVKFVIGLNFGFEVMRNM